MQYSEVLIKPLISEKSTLEREKGVYVFKIAPKANKILVKQAIESIFPVKVNKVAILVQKPKVSVNLKTGKKTKKNSFKKAYVYIKNKAKITELDI